MTRDIEYLRDRFLASKAQETNPQVVKAISRTIGGLELIRDATIGEIPYQLPNDIGRNLDRRSEKGSQCYRHDMWEYDFDEQVVMVDSCIEELTRIQAKLLSAFIAKEGQTYPFFSIIHDVWNDHVGLSTLRANINRLRKKLHEDKSDRKKSIVIVPSIGYSLKTPFSNE